MEKKTLADYIKGYPMVEVYLLLTYRKDNHRYKLVKQPGHNVFYILDRDEVLAKEYISEDHLEKLSIKYLNTKSEEIKHQIENQESYKFFKKFIDEVTGDNYSLDR